MIILAEITDAKLLTEIALQSKAFWGYSNELIESWKADLTVTPKMITSCSVFKFMQDNKLVGFYILSPPKENVIELQMLFVLPKFIGKGVGKQLLHHSLANAYVYKISKVTVLADPNAVPFYTSQGFVVIGKKESSVKGRFLPIMQKSIG